MTTSLPAPRRGEVWDIDFDPIVGHEQGGRRPGLIVSVDPFNAGPSTLVFAVPMTRTDRGVPAHVPVSPPKAGSTPGHSSCATPSAPSLAGGWCATVGWWPPPP